MSHSPSGEAVKIGSSKKLLNLSVNRRIYELYSLVSRQIYGSRGSQGLTPRPGTFLSDVEPINVTSYIHRCHVTDERILYSSVIYSSGSSVNR
jgi:hypothetical protein